MSYQIYVGNFPTEFSEEDLNQLFLDFEGIRLVKFFKAEKKCFAFFYCVNRKQVIDVCLQMNNLHVRGRKLIVRATDNDLQSYIKNSEEYFNESNAPNSGENLDFKSYNKERISYSNVQKPEPFNMYGSSAVNEFSRQNLFQMPSNIDTNDHLSHLQINPLVLPSSDRNLSDLFGKYRNVVSDSNPEDGSHSVPSNGKTYNHAQKSFSSMPPLETYSMNPVAASNHYSPNLLQTNSFDNYDSRFQNMELFSDMPPLEPVNAAGTSKYDCPGQEQYYAPRPNKNKGIKYNSNYDLNDQSFSHGRFDYPRSSESHQQKQKLFTYPETQFHDNKCSYVSVLNFPIGTTYEELFKLFSEFSPIDIAFKCNVARRDRTPTEAIICFSKKQDATNAILTLDNTRYKNRIILVNDLDDLTMAMELLSVAGKH